MSWHKDMPDDYMNQIVTGDCRELAKRIPDESVDLIFTDPPYAKEYLNLYNWLGEMASKKLAPDGFILTYCGNYWMHEGINRILPFMDYFFTYVEVNNGNSTILWPRRTIVRYKPILCFRKYGSKALPQTNVLGVWAAGGTDKRFHKWGQSETTAKYYIDCFSRPGDVILDPFVGGGTAAAVSKKLGRNYIAFEVDELAADIARGRMGHISVPNPIPEQKELL